MAAARGLVEVRAKPREFQQRRRRRQSIVVQKNIEEDVLMASAIGDVSWLQQSLWDHRKAYAKSKEHGLAPIHLAAKHGQLDCLKAMVERYKVDINLQSETGWTPLHLAINTANKRRALRCVTYLLQNGADPSLPNYVGFTPVHQAAAEGYVKCLQALINSGAAIDRIDSDGNTPMDLARVWGHRACARILSNRQWYLDKERVLEEKLEEELKARQQAEEMKRLALLRRIEGRNRGQMAFKKWLYEKHIPDVPTMYGPLPCEERRLVEELKKKRRSPSPQPVVTESSIVVQSKEEFDGLPSFMRNAALGRKDSDADKKLELIPLERISASRKNRAQRADAMNMRQNRGRMTNRISPSITVSR